MASGLLRTLARRGGSTFRSGGEGLAAPAIAFGRHPVRRLSKLATPGDQLPGCPNEKVDALVDKFCAEKSSLLPKDSVVQIFVSSMHARKDYNVKQLWRFWMTSSVLISGCSIGHYVFNHINARAGAPKGN